MSSIGLRMPVSATSGSGFGPWLKDGWPRSSGWSGDYLELKDDLEPVGCAELLERLQAGEVVVLDVRPEEEYRAGHLPGALFVPPGEVERRLSQPAAGLGDRGLLPGPVLRLRGGGGQVLRRNGFAARRMEQGIPEWRLPWFSRRSRGGRG